MAAPLIVIVGPTASGKSGLAVSLAERHNGEIICADSRTVFKGMDIGTAKPSREDQARVPHWGIDLVEPGEHFSAADFQTYTLQKISEIRARGNVPFLVGGTGLYVDGIVFNYQFGAPANVVLRDTLNGMSIDDLRLYCKKNNVMLPENEKNKRHLVRAIEQNGINKERQSTPINNCIIVGIATDNGTLLERIHARSEQLFEDGVVEEANMLGKKYGWENEAMSGNIYKLIFKFNHGELTRDSLREAFEQSDRRLAKRQRTWFKRNQFIEWKSLNEAEKYLDSSLAPSE